MRVMPILMNAVNLPDGTTQECDSLQATHALISENEGATAFIGISDPSLATMQEIAQRFGMNELAVEDSMEGHQRAKIERYGDNYFLVLRPAAYLDEKEEIHFGEIHLFMGANFLIGIIKDYLREERDIKRMFSRFSHEMGERETPWDMVHAALDTVVDGYIPVIEGLEDDCDEIEEALFAPGKSDTSSISRRTYELLNEVSDFKRACRPLLTMLDTLMGRLRTMTITPDSPEGRENVDDLRHLRDVRDHATQINERIDDLRYTLQNVLEVNSTIVAERQNDDTKRISSWAAIFVVPTVIGSIYGMNFEHMPELSWTYGYPASLLMMFLAALALYLIFKRKGWM